MAKYCIDRLQLPLLHARSSSSPHTTHMHTHVAAGCCGLLRVRAPKCGALVQNLPRPAAQVNTMLGLQQYSGWLSSRFIITPVDRGVPWPQNTWACERPLGAYLSTSLCEVEGQAWAIESECALRLARNVRVSKKACNPYLSP